MSKTDKRRLHERIFLLLRYLIIEPFKFVHFLSNLKLHVIFDKIERIRALQIRGENRAWLSHLVFLTRDQKPLYNNVIHSGTDEKFLTRCWFNRWFFSLACSFLFQLCRSFMKDQGVRWHFSSNIQVALYGRHSQMLGIPAYATRVDT